MLSKLLFGVFVVLALIMLTQSIQIVVYHFQRLNDFGFGVLIGKIALFLLFTFISYLLYIKGIRPQSKKSTNL